MACAYLMLIAERDALAWVIRSSRAAFPANRSTDAQQLSPGDVLLLYTTRGCYHNPSRDRGRVIGEAEILTRSLSFALLGDSAAVLSRTAAICV
jgi:hypothetical protein